MYEKQLEEIGRRLEGEIVANSYNASIEDEDLKIFIVAGWIKGCAVNELTDSQIKNCIEKTFKRKVVWEKLYLVDNAVRSV